MSAENKNQKQWYIDYFDSFEKNLNGDKKLFLHENRKNALAGLAVAEFPTQRDEDWKYTNVNPILKQSFIPAFNAELTESAKKEIEDKFFCGFECHRLVFVNGLFNKEMSSIKPLPEGVVIGSLRNSLVAFPDLVRKAVEKASAPANAFNLLNKAFNLDGLFVYVPKGKVISEPVQVLYLNGSSSEQVLSSPWNVVYAEERSEINVILNYSGIPGKSYFTNIVTDVTVGEGAVVNLYKVQGEMNESYHIEKVEVNQSAGSLFNHFSLSFGGAIVRNDINSKLDGENCETHYYGLYLGSGNQHIDNHTFVDHAKPNCMSNELYKGILDGSSKGVFNGKILVRPDAQKTNAYQSNKTILLSDKAKIDTKPQLEIFADDVKCSHGATIGRLDETAYFYIRSRGIPAELAKSMLIRAFANDVIESIKIPDLKEKLNHMIFDHLHRVDINNQ